MSINSLDRHSKITKKRLYLFALFFVLFEGIAYASNDMIMPGMLNVVNQFHVGLGFVASSLSVFLFGNTILQLFIGPSADRFGKKKILIIGNSLFIAFTILIALSATIYQFMLGRLLQGSCLAFIAIGYSIIHEKFNDKDAVKLIALMANITILAPLFGPVLGGVIIIWSGWREIFIIIGAVALIALIGLTKYTPPSKIILHRIYIKDAVRTYTLILKQKKFAIGCISICLAPVPIIAWIGLAPVIIMKTANLSFSHYIFYQIIALGGLSLASILMQFIAGKLSYYKIMFSGTTLFFFGSLFSLLFSYNALMISIGFFINSLGLGFFNGMAFRLMMSDNKYSQNMTMSLLVFVQTIFMAGGMELINIICEKYGFSLFSFALLNFLSVVAGSIFMFCFARMNKDKMWV